MVNINIKIPEEIHKKLRIEALRKDITLKEFIVKKLEAYSRDKERR